MTPGVYLSNLIGLPELEIKHIHGSVRGWLFIEAVSSSKERHCPKCATLSQTVYDHRHVEILDSPLRERKVRLRIKKKRFLCKLCKRPFTELLHGIFSGARITERLRRTVLWSCRKFQNLVQVGNYVGCSSSTVRRSLYAHLEVDVRRHLNYPWPEKLGIDEHAFGRSKSYYSGTEFNTVFTDIEKHRLYRVGFTKNSKKLFEQFKDLPGGENVKDVTIDLSESFRSLSRALFPNARITADKFHVVKLLLPAINKRRKQIAGDRRVNPIGRLLLRSRCRLDFFKKSTIERWLEPHDELKKIYWFKERINELYRIKGRRRAEIAFDRMMGQLKENTHIPELKTLHYTFSRWRTEILNYFDTGMTNAMCEGFNSKAKLLKKMGYGYRNQNNFGLRLLNICFH